MRPAASLGVSVVCLLLLSGGCSRREESDSQARDYEARGIIRGFAPDHSTIEVAHEDIPGFMPAMTMPFVVKDPKLFAPLRVGDAIAFRLRVTTEDSWIDQIKTIDPAEVHLLLPKTEASAPLATARLRPGDLIPPFELTDQDGEKITAETFRGRPLIVTFIFTRCPLPNFCPLMNRNFAQLQQAVKQGSGRLAQTRLLSISFDPEFDTIEILKQEATHEQADPAIWKFATGAPEQIRGLTSGFSVQVQPEAGTISHGLATALIDDRGQIVEIWRGNAWKPDEVLSQIRQ